MKKAIIKSVSGGIFTGIDEEHEEVVLHSPGKIKKVGKLLVGDVVYYDESTENNTIIKVAERRNEFIRPKAANIDIFLIVQSIDEPRFDRYLIDKLTVYAFKQNAHPILLVTKADLNEELASELYDEYNSIGIKTFLGRIENNSYDEIFDYLSEKTVLLVGNSGVGKSTFLNNLHGYDVQETNIISKKLGRGKHTTRQVEIFPIEDFYLIDTPGFSTLELETLDDGEMLSDFFPEFQKYKNECRFNTCTHINEPGCRVKQALEDGDINKMRYESYLRLFKELKERKEKW